MNRDDAYTIKKAMIDNNGIAADFIAAAFAAAIDSHKPEMKEIADDCRTLFRFLVQDSASGPQEWWTEDGIEDLLEARIEYNSIIDELAENFADIIRCLRVSIPD